MSNSKISADLNDIPSLTHLTHLPKFPTNIKHEPFTLNLKQDPSEIIIQSGVYPERNYENNEDINNDLNKPENMLLEIYGLTKNKKENINFDLEDFDGIPENSKENLQFSDGLLKKLEKKALNYQNSLDYLHEEKKVMKLKGYTKEHEEIENIVNHSEFEKIDLVSQFISDLEKPSLNKIEEIIKNAKNSFKQIEQEYILYQQEQDLKLKNRVSHENMAFQLMGEESGPRAVPEENDDFPKPKTLIENDVSSKLKKLMTSLKQTSKLQKETKTYAPKTQVNAEKIRFDKNFKHFLKKKKNSFLQKTVTSPESQRNSISPLPFPEVRQSKRIIEHISKSELDLIQFFFEDIPKAENNCVLKSDISKYMLSNPNILELYNLNPKNLVVELNSYTTSNTNGLTLKELVQFLKTPRDIPISMSEFSKDQLKSMKQSLITDLPNVCLLTDDEINTMRNVFKDLDKAGDLTVNRKQLINALRKDIKISQILQNPAVYLPKCDKVLIFNRLLHQIEREEFYGEEINRKAKESIAWQHFISHFTNYRRVFYISRELFHKIKNKIDLRTIFDDQELLDLSPEHISYFKAAIESLEKTPENYFFLPDLLKTLKKDHKFEFLSQENARRASEKFSLPNEKIGEVLKRMEKEADDHLDWDEFLEFFTRRGRPKYFIIDKEERRRVYKLVLDEVLPGKIHTKKFKTLKKKFYIEEDQNNEEEENLYDDADSLKKENILVEGYDSDPEYQLKQAKTIALKETAFIKAKKVGFFGAMFKENIDREAFKITVPHPFSFNEREKNKIKVKSISQIKLENSLFNKDKEELEALQVRIKPQPVPKNIKDHHLWSKIRQNQEKRRLDVKKRSKAMTLQTEKPFSFLFRDKSKKEEEEIRRKTKKEREKYQFKANPIPWFSSLKLMIDPETKENERREKLARNANISLSLSRLPPRMEQYEKERREKELIQGYEEEENLLNSNFTFKPKISGRVPDFERLQRKFEDILETKKQNFVPTEPLAPKCSQTTRNVKRDYMDEDNYLLAKEGQKKRDPMEIALKLRASKPKIQAASTLKFQALFEKRKQEAEEKQRKIAEVKREEEERVYKQQRMRSKVQNSSAIVDNTNELQKRKSDLIKSHKDKIKNDTNSYLYWKRELEERMEQKPLLLESINKFTAEKTYNKSRDFDQIAQLLEENNLEAFNEEEREIIKEMAHLKNQGFKIEDFQSS